MLDIPQKKLHQPAGKSTVRGTQGESQCPKLVAIPYCRGLSETCQWIFRDRGITTYLKPWNTLRQERVLMNSKSATPSTKSVVNNVIAHTWEKQTECSKPGLKNTLEKHPLEQLWGSISGILGIRSPLTTSRSWMLRDMG